MSFGTLHAKKLVKPPKLPISAQAAHSIQKIMLAGMSHFPC
jgi:hypothetical protein